MKRAKKPRPICPKCGSAAVAQTATLCRCARCEHQGKPAAFKAHAFRPEGNLPGYQIVAKRPLDEEGK